MGDSWGPDWDLAVFAHEDLSHPHVDVPTLLVVLVGAGLVVLVASVVPLRHGPPPDEFRGTSSWWGALSPAQAVVRALSVLALALVVVAGRAGVDDELENLAPALTVGAGWPLLVAGSLALGSVWRWLDPWDTVARLLAPGDRSEPSPHVWPAVALVGGWLWFLGVYPRPLDPRAVGLAVACYSLLTVAGCLAVGRVRWLSSAEPIGLTLSWVGLLPRRRLASWAPPRGAAALLGATIAGLLFGVVRRTELWSPVAVRHDAQLWATLGLLAAVLLGAGIGAAGQRSGAGVQAGSVARALVPVVAGVALAVALARNRLFTSVQLLPGLVGDPLGRGWDTFGSPTAGLDPAPIGAAGLVVLQIALVVGSLLLAAATAPRPLVGDERLPTIAVLTGCAVGALWTLSLH